ncbi:Ctr copper transporter [Basidiobolus meristosporus CBS 931.73]|uniref:Copper transport protein n=1 Tax=Basidiobolus meristosporus CBS 931.73 TaxID=1314790 RepID=A0A1Y1YXQ3_9FUNG|nr:Ctr copper transporter [Basidiobolus meristosporus CBS 931.73]|eukprot:ORY02716.1 Ctr copper transporter [Basidiobolus meristosporus CBS 931.73]
MTLNWDYQNLCVVFGGWEIQTLTGVLAICLGTFCLSLTYELVRLVIRVLDHQILMRRGTVNQQLARSTMYAIQVSISFCLMLVFMTFNGFLMLSVILGAFIGFLLFSQDTLATTAEVRHH